MELLTEIAILVLAAFVGFEVISRVPNTLHTPLMSGTNAIHGIVVLGGILLIGPAHGFLNEALLVVAIAFGTINVIGDFLCSRCCRSAEPTRPSRARSSITARSSKRSRRVTPRSRRVWCATTRSTWPATSIGRSSTWTERRRACPPISAALHCH